MQAIWAFFEIWSIGFWLLAGVAAIIFTVAAEKETHFLAAVAAIVLGCAYWKHVKSIDYQLLFLGIGLYFLVGAIWSLYRWAKYVRESVKAKPSLKSGDYDISASYQKSKISAWILYWPFSAFWNISEDVLTNFTSWIYRSLGGVYDSITERAIKSAKK